MERDADAVAAMMQRLRDAVREVGHLAPAPRRDQLAAEAVAEGSGIPLRVVRAWMSDDDPKAARRPSIAQLIRLATHLRISPTYLMTGEGSPFIDGASRPARTEAESVRRFVVERTARDRAQPRPFVEALLPTGEHMLAGLVRQGTVTVDLYLSIPAATRPESVQFVTPPPGAFAGDVAVTQIMGELERHYGHKVKTVTVEGARRPSRPQH